MVPYCAGIGMRLTSAGLATTRLLMVRNSAGTLTRHMISPVRPSYFSIGPRPFFHWVVAGLISWVSSTSLKTAGICSIFSEAGLVTTASSTVL